MRLFDLISALFVPLAVGFGVWGIMKYKAGKREDKICWSIFDLLHDNGIDTDNWLHAIQDAAQGKYVGKEWVKV